MIYRGSPQSGRLKQGEIVSNLIQMRLALESVGSPPPPLVNTIRHPFAIVLTQDCDLESDHKRRTEERQTGSLMGSILFCEVAEADELKKEQDIKSDIWRRIRANKDERYQYLRELSLELDAARRGTSALVLDFKRYFTIPTDEVYKRLEIGELQRRAYIETPFREHLATRFFYFQCRVALPEDHFLRPKKSEPREA